MCDEYMMGNLRQRERTVLWLRGRTKVLDDFLNIINNIHIYPSVTAGNSKRTLLSCRLMPALSAVHTNDDSHDERDRISPDLESSFDELSLTEESSLSSSPLTTSLHSDEYTHAHMSHRMFELTVCVDRNTCPQGLAGSKPLSFSRNRRIKTHGLSVQYLSDLADRCLDSGVLPKQEVKGRLCSWPKTERREQLMRYLPRQAQNCWICTWKQVSSIISVNLQTMATLFFS